MFHYSIAVIWIFFLQASSCITVIQNPKSLSVHEGDFTTINCTFNHGNEHLAASAEFFRMPDDRNPMNSSSDGRIIFNSSDTSLIMTIHRATSCDSGTYVCKVKFFYGTPFTGHGTILDVIASKNPTTGTKEESSSAQTIVELIRISLMMVLIILSFLLLCKFW